jgi:hypothetical protein
MSGYYRILAVPGLLLIDRFHDRPGLEPQSDIHRLPVKVANTVNPVIASCKSWGEMDCRVVINAIVGSNLPFTSGHQAPPVSQNQT